MDDSKHLTAEDQRLDDCEALLEYRFRDRELLRVALTHASVAATRTVSNERMEFLGDAILGAIVCEMLYRRFPEDTEGELTRLKSMLVSRQTCAELALETGLVDHLAVGRGLADHDGVPLSVRAAVLESVVGAVYLDGGLAAAQTIVERMLSEQLEGTARAERSRNFKSLLQQRAQRLHGDTPVYRLLDEKGPDHSKCFKIAAVVGTRTFPAAWGPSKKEAEQRAAENAFCVLEGDPTPHATDA